MDVFAATVETLHPDIVGVTESWATDKIYDAELELTGYTLFRKDRVLKRGGGVLLYVKKELEAVEFEPHTVFPEHVWCMIRDSDRNELVIGVCYRSGNTEVYEDGSHQPLRKLMDEMGKHRMVLMGDFNYGGID